MITNLSYQEETVDQRTADTPQPSGLHIEALGSTCLHNTTVANCDTCRPTTGGTR